MAQPDSELYSFLTGGLPVPSINLAVRSRLAGGLTGAQDSFHWLILCHSVI